MQGHRQDHIAIGKQLLACPLHPSGHPGRQIRPVMEFQRHHHALCRSIMANGRAQAPERRRIGNGLGTQKMIAIIMREGDAKHRAIGSLDKTKA